MSVEEIIDRALKLPRDERAYVADRIEESLALEAADAGLESAWAAELERRADQVERGEVKLIPVEVAIAEARKELHQARAGRGITHSP